MRLNRSLTPVAASLGLTVLLAACAQPADPTPLTPTAPPPSASPTQAAPPPSADPSVAPSPTPTDVIQHELPMVARATEDVDVHALPSADSPLLEGDRFSDMARVEIRLEADQIVEVTLGPVLVDGTSWYEVRATDGGDFNFEGGWVPGEILKRDSDLPATDAQVVVIHGFGSGTAVNVDFPLVGTPTTVRFAAAPMADRDECEIDVTLIRTDGLGVNIATQTVTDPEVVQLAASDLSSLFMEEAGTATLQVRTDCNYAAALITPPV